LARLIPFLIYEAKRKKRWIWVEPHSHKKLVNPILEENINPIKCGIQAKLDLKKSEHRKRLARAELPT
jgi:hypothetical protein